MKISKPTALNKPVMKLVLMFLLFISMFSASYAFNACNVSIDEPWFIVTDSNGEDVLITDGEGDMFFRGEDHSLNNKDSEESFVVDNNIFFNRVTSSYTSFSDDVSSLPSGDGFIIRDSSGSDVAIFEDSGRIYTAGKGAVQGQQAGCSPDGNYCNADGITRENRDYYCDITGSRSGSCTYSVTSTYDCSDNNFYYCSGNARYRAYFECSGGSCYRDHNTFIEACSGCQICDGGGCVDDDSECSGCETCSDGSCVDDDSECSGCETCSDGSCVDDDSECSGCETCSDGSCVDDDSECSGCETCSDGSCVDDDSNCDSGESCDDGECVGEECEITSTDNCVGSSSYCTCYTWYYGTYDHGEEINAYQSGSEPYDGWDGQAKAECDGGEWKLLESTCFRSESFSFDPTWPSGTDSSGNLVSANENTAEEFCQEQGYDMCRNPDEHYENFGGEDVTACWNANGGCTDCSNKDDCWAFNHLRCDDEPGWDNDQW